MSNKPATLQIPFAVTSSAQKTLPNLSVFDALADGAFIRESQLVQSPKRPGSPAPLPFSAPTLWRKVKAGTPEAARGSTRTININIGGRQTSINVASDADANALTSLLRQLESAQGVAT